ncbi:amidohydrolase family protein [Pedobacter antarcticus]|uniref:amidohydrolase family protein n=1 Tax=Pedobacter antarcticus TaxID=34086 RepID=UPI002930668F|nr:amidohydrolase family protein [Pedobacter antarcticus]
MKKTIQTFFITVAGILLLQSCNNSRKTDGNTILFKNVRLIDGNGGQPVENMRILIQGDTIAGIGADLDTASATQVIDLNGKTVMPAMISAHVHIGTLKGTTTAADHYTRENILAQLQKYLDYGVSIIQVMGTDRPMLFESGLRDSSLNGQLPGARLYSAGYGFNVPNGPSPALSSGKDYLFRPSMASQVPAQIDSLAKIKASVVKIWQDKFGGDAKPMSPAVFKAIIDQAHQHKLRVAAHVYYLSDARDLIDNDVDIIGHSIRDSVISDALIQEMKQKKVVYIPTLALDEFSFIYGSKPDWLDDPFFKASLEPGVLAMITAPGYEQEVRNSQGYTRNKAGFEIALKNLKKLYDAGILVAMGTDSGATPLRAQGFSEHLELELMVQAGLTPLQAIGTATKNSAIAMQLEKRYGTLEKGKVADLIILSGNPVEDIKNTRKIEAVYKAGKKASSGPLSNSNAQ